MDIKEVKEKKDIAQGKITTILETLEAETECAVQDIEIERVYFFSGSTIVAAWIKLELP